VAYLVPPLIEVPLASRRLGESGTVWLRVRVGRDGLPQQITLQRSSGFERLDRQAQEAMQRARFKPQIEDGVATEWVVVAPLQYDLN
jgi:protein TonB